MNSRICLLFFFLLPLLFFGCKEDETIVGIVDFEVDYVVDNDSLEFDVIRYVNEAGNGYGVSRLEYYISDITFLKSDAVKFQSSYIHYANARVSSTNSFSLPAIPEGDYDCIELTIGLNPEDNSSNSLPNTTENINMAWPDVMGGGYHFMKFEGHFIDSASATAGFAMHLGENGNAIKVKISGLSISVRKEQAVSIRLKMNLNEWSRDPSTFDFNIDGNYSMGVMTAMQKLAANGTDVFTATVE